MEVSDEQLLIQWREGEPLALETLVRRYQVPLFAYLYRLSGDRAAAEDLSQEAWARFLTALDRFDPGRRLSTWLYAIATNLWRDASRGSRTRAAAAEHLPELRSGLGITTPPTPLEEASRRELESEVRGAVHELPEEYRAVLVMRHYQGLRYAEIAEVLGCPVGTVKSRIHYAISNLRDRFERKGILAEGGAP